MPANPIHPDELNSLMTSVSALIIIDVRHADDYDFKRIPNAISNPVFEVAFSNKMAELVPDLATPICVYGSQKGSIESTEAAQKLIRLGYDRIYDMTSGFTGWNSNGHPLESGLSPEPQPAQLADGRYPIDTKESCVQWTGKNLINSHSGEISIASGQLEIQGGQLVDLELTIDFKSITCTDLADSDMHDILIQHLESDDFFYTDRFPTGKFQLTGSEAQGDLNDGSLNLQIDGDLTIRGKTKPISLFASTGVTDELRPAAQAYMSIDRTHWGMRYGSGKFFSRLAGHLVNDHIGLQLKIIGELTAKPE
jgi:polyisoprenoid-binding protein YceI